MDSLTAFASECLKRDLVNILVQYLGENANTNEELELV